MDSIQPVPYRIVDRPGFTILGRKVYISGPDNDQFGRFWQTCRADGTLAQLAALRAPQGGQITGAAYLGVSRVEQDPTKRDFYYMIAIEADGSRAADLESYDVPARRWAVFECHGKPPESIVAAEMFAFMRWLPDSSYRHALAPEMEVYPYSSQEDYCEFWLPVE